MFGLKSHANNATVAVVDIASTSAGVAIVRTGKALQILASARESLSFEERSDDALASGVIQMLSSACEKVLAAYAEKKGPRISTCYCIVGAPWTRTISGQAIAQLKGVVTVTDAMVAELAKRALVDQKSIDASKMFEANVSRVLLNGYPTSEPAGKRAEEMHIFTLMSDCDSRIKDGAKEALAKAFPGATVVWRSSARALLSLTKLHEDQNRLIVEVGAEATDVICVRKGILADRALIPKGIRHIATELGNGKPVEEVISMLDMVEKQQTELEAGGEFEKAIAKLEPDLAKIFGETFAKLSAVRKLPEELVLIAPPQVSLWLSKFFSRIDFTQFTATTRPFSVAILSGESLVGTQEVATSFADAGLTIASALVNIEQVS